MCSSKNFLITEHSLLMFDVEYEEEGEGIKKNNEHFKYIIKLMSWQGEHKGPKIGKWGHVDYGRSLNPTLCTLL